MLIKLDIRETRLISLIRALATDVSGIQIETPQLALGDISICEDDGTERVLIERKTPADLGASIIDGRYREQGRRLQGCEHSPHNIYYLIEGDISRYRGRCKTVTASTLRSTLISLSFVKGFSVHCVSNMDESARWILQFAKRLGADKKPRGRYETNESNESRENTSYVEVCSRVKKEQINAENALPIMLSQIPGVSSVTAMAIASRFPDMCTLIAAMQSDEKALDSITTTSATGKTRKIAATVKQRIRAFLGVQCA